MDIAFQRSPTAVCGLVIAMFMLTACASPSAAVLTPTTAISTPAVLPTAGQPATEPGAAPPTQVQSPDTPVTSPPQPLPGGGEAPEQPFAPQPGDKALQTGEVYLDVMDVLTLESFPPQFVLRLEGSLPTPCHQMRVQVTPPDADGQIQIEVFSLVDPAAICTQVLQGFEASVPLTSLPSGTFTVVVNDIEAAEISVP